jgi:DNA-binding transcriptional regulator YiaG
VQLLTLVRHQSYSSCMSSPASTATVTRSGSQGETFRAARKGAGLSIRQLAKRADISHTTISRWERGEREIGEPTFQHLSLALTDYMAGRWAA